MDKTLLIKQFEGLKLEAYLCPAGVWTIGYGHTGDDVQKGSTITLEEAERLIKEDTVLAEMCIKTYVNQYLNDNQLAALLSLVYNIGIDAFVHSTLLKRLNNADASCSEEFLRWHYVKGLASTGLIKRRIAEQKLFDTPMEEENGKSV